MILQHVPHTTGRVVSIGDGVAGIFDTVHYMRRLVNQAKVDPDVRANAITIVQLQPEKDAPAEIRALFEFVRDSIRYVGDVAGVETVATPDATLRLRAGDCDDKAVLLAALLESIGYPTRFAIAGYSSPDVFEHVYVYAMLPNGAFVPLDPTEQQPLGWEQPCPVAFWMEPT